MGPVLASSSTKAFGPSGRLGGRHALLGSLGLAAVAAGISFGSGAITQSDVSTMGAQAARNFMQLIDARSPGERTEAQLTKSKKKAAALPSQRALGKVFPPEAERRFADALTATPRSVPIIPEVPLLAEAVPPAVLFGAPAAVVPATPIAGVVLPPVVGGPSTPGAPGAPGGPGSPGTPGTPGQPGLPDTGVTPTVPPIVPPIPEPGTWASMLLGFAIMGLSIRRRRQRVTAAVAR